MKLSEYAKKNSVTYRTAWNHFKQGKIGNARQLHSGTIVVDEKVIQKQDEYTVVYSRVSSSKNKNNLDSQADRIVKFCNAKGWGVDKVVKEVGSGLNDNRTKLLKILSDPKITRIVVEHKDRLTRFGFKYIDQLCIRMNCELIVINSMDGDKEDLIQDFISVITSFCARIYGIRRSKRKTEQLINQLEEEKDQK